MGRHMAVRAGIILALAVMVVAPLPTALARNSSLARPTAAEPGPAGVCETDSPLSVKVTADELLLDRYHLGNHPVAVLPHVLTWSEDPFSDRNWVEKLHMMRYLMALMYQWKASSDQAYLDRALQLVRSWIARNPLDDPPSEFSWGDHSTAWRAMTMVCMAQLLPTLDWLDAAITQHGEVLAQPSFYKVNGNHALNQDIGLLDVGCYLGRTDWEQLAAARIDDYITRSIDEQGVSAEQAVRYDRYTYFRFQAARKHLEWCGYPEPDAFHLVDQMPTFLAQATRPDGYYETIGDSPRSRAAVIRGTDSEYAASQGQEGAPPSKTVRVFRAGYAFGRTGWGIQRDFADEAFFSLRFGPGTLLGHAHDDGGAVTLYAWGSPLIVDPGFGDYNKTAFRTFFKSRAAHSAVTAGGVTSRPRTASKLIRKTTSTRSLEVVVQVNVYPGVLLRRRVVFSRRLGYLLVEDTMSSAAARTYRQLWHLPEDADPVTTGTMTWSGRARGNVLIRQLIAGGSTRTITGALDPIQGWISHVYGEREPAPVVEYRQNGKQVRFLTLLMPYRRGTPTAGVRDLHVTRTGFALSVQSGGSRELVSATATGASITTAP